MGKAQSKSMNVTTADQAASAKATVVEEGTAGKVGKIEETTNTPAPANGDTAHEAAAAVASDSAVSKLLFYTVIILYRCMIDAS